MLIKWIPKNADNNFSSRDSSVVMKQRLIRVRFVYSLSLSVAKYRASVKQRPLSLGTIFPPVRPTDTLSESRQNKVFRHDQRRYYYFDVHRAVHRNIISLVKKTRCTNVLNLFYFGMTLNMFRTIFPSIIRVQYCTYSNRHLSNRYCCLLASKWIQEF